MHTVRPTLSRFAPDASAPECAKLGADTNLEAKLEAAGWFAVPAGPRGKPCWVSGNDIARAKTRAWGVEQVLVAKLVDGGAAVLRMAADLVADPDATKAMGVLQPGEDVEVLETKGQLAKVRTSGGSVGWMAKKALNDAAQAVVKTAAVVTQDPKKGGNAGQLNAGDMVTILSASRDFVKLKMQDGTIGWVASKALAQLHEFAPVAEHLKVLEPVLQGVVNPSAAPAAATPLAAAAPVTAMAQAASSTGELTVDMWIQKSDGTVVAEGAGLKEGDEYEVHAVCSQDCYLRVTGETPETNTLCQYSPIHVKGFDTSPLIKAGEDAWPKLLPAGAHYKVFPPVMTQDIVRVEAIPAAAGAQPFQYVEGKGNAPGCTPTSSGGAAKSRSVGIVFGSATATPPAQPVPATVHQRAFFTNPADATFTLLAAEDPAAPTPAETRSLAAAAPAKKQAAGPRIEVVGVSSTSSGVVEMQLRFAPRTPEAAVDVESFKARLWQGKKAQDVTASLKKFVTDNGVLAPGAKLPKGNYTLEVSLADTTGKQSVEVKDFVVK